MRVLRNLLLVLGLLVFSLVLIGMFLPAHFRVARSLHIHAPPGLIFVQLDDPHAWRSWSVWTRRDPNMRISYGGTARGRGASWAWQSKTEGNGTMLFTDSQPPDQLHYRLSFPDFGMVSTGVLKLEPDADGTLVTWTNEGEMNRNPLNRFMGLFMDRLVGPDFEAGLQQLKRQVEAGGH